MGNDERPKRGRLYLWPSCSAVIALVVCSSFGRAGKAPEAFASAVSVLSQISMAAGLYAVLWLIRFLVFGERRILLWLAATAVATAVAALYVSWVSAPAIEARREQRSLYRERLKALSDFERDKNLEQLSGLITVASKRAIFRVGSLSTVTDEEKHPFTLTVDAGVSAIAFPTIDKTVQITVQNKSSRSTLALLWFKHCGVMIRGINFSDHKDAREGVRDQKMWARQRYSKIRGRVFQVPRLPESLRTRLNSVDPYTLSQKRGTFRVNYGMILGPGKSICFRKHLSGFPPREPYNPLFLVHYEALYKPDFSSSDMPKEVVALLFVPGKAFFVLLAAVALFECVLLLWAFAARVERSVGFRKGGSPMKRKQTSVVARRLDVELQRVRQEALSVRKQAQAQQSATVIGAYLRHKKSEILSKFRLQEHKRIEEFFNQQAATIHAAERAYKAQERLKTAQERTRLEVENELSLLKTQHANQLENTAVAAQKRREELLHEGEMRWQKERKGQLEIEEREIELSERRNQLEQSAVKREHKDFRKKTRREVAQEFEEYLRGQVKLWKESGQYSEEDIATMKKQEINVFMVARRKREEQGYYD